MAIQYPPFLKKKDCIGITCPAGFLAPGKADRCIETLQKWGFEVMVGRTVHSTSTNYFAGTESERLQELQAMLDHPDIRAILCGRGGYGVSQLLDQLDFRAFKKHPKWIIGFSDITALHLHLNRKLKTASIHASMAAAFQDSQTGSLRIQNIRKLLTGMHTRISADPHPLNQKGMAEAELIGGNLTLITHLIGTSSAVSTRGKILFIEDIGEYIYSSDRMFLQLKRAGLLNELAGLIVGGFTDMKDTERPFGSDIYTAISRQLGTVSYPVCFGFPISHGQQNMPVISGGMYQLRVGKTVTLNPLTTIS